MVGRHTFTNRLPKVVRTEKQVLSDKVVDSVEEVRVRNDIKDTKDTS